MSRYQRGDGWLLRAPDGAPIGDERDDHEPVDTFDLWCPRCGLTDRARRALCRRPECPKKEKNT